MKTVSRSSITLALLFSLLVTGPVAALSTSEGTAAPETTIAQDAAPMPVQRSQLAPSLPLMALVGVVALIAGFSLQRRWW